MSYNRVRTPWSTPTHAGSSGIHPKGEMKIKLRTLANMGETDCRYRAKRSQLDPVGQHQHQHNLTGACCASTAPPRHPTAHSSQLTPHTRSLSTKKKLGEKLSNYSLLRSMQPIQYILKWDSGQSVRYSTGTRRTRETRSLSLEGNVLTLILLCLPQSLPLCRALPCQRSMSILTSPHRRSHHRRLRGRNRYCCNRHRPPRSHPAQNPGR